VNPAQGKIPAAIFSDPEVYRLEMDRTFSRCWLFVAHASEVPAPGDYVTRYMGEQPVIAVRGEDRRVRVLLNVCRHRGMRVCRADLGNASHFRCPYHGFTYKNTGDLIGVPFHKDIYDDALDRDALGLIPARTESYADLIFATWDHRGPSLENYLGPMRWYLDLLARRAEMEVVGPPQRHEMDANWKLPAENFASDAYHTFSTHASISEIGLTPSAKWAKGGYHISAGNGHACMIGAPTAQFIFPKELMDVYQRNLAPDQFEIQKQMAHMVGTVFPNLSFLISAITLKGQLISHTELFHWQPKGPDRIELNLFFLVEKEAPAEWKERSRQAWLLTFGTAGVLSQDDAENWTDITRNSRGPVVRGLAFNYEMGLAEKALRDFPGPGRAFEGKYNEANARAFYGRWLELLRSGERGVRAAGRRMAKGGRVGRR
jgi:phenylpropionate dioxygenase-like ring-hydroxylating dioxygenase large terminal subunit